MINSLAPISTGTPFAYIADRENRISKAVEWVETGLAGGIQNIGNAGGFGPVDILVQNDTGTPLDRFDVVQLDGLVFEPDDEELDGTKGEFFERPVFKCKIPSEDGIASYAVLQEAIPASTADVKNMGRARLVGVSLVRVKFDDAEIETNEFADTVEDEKYLEGSGTGSALVLWREGIEGEQWGVVQFKFGGGGCPPLNTIWVVTQFGYVSSGTYKLLVTGSPTAPIQYTASTADVQSALELLPTVGAGNVRVTGGPRNLTIEFIEDMKQKPVVMSIDASALDGIMMGALIYIVQQGHK